MYKYAELNSKVLASPCSLTLIRAGVRPELSDWDIPPGIRTEWMLFHNSAGKAFVHFSGESIELAPGRIVLIPPFTPYSTTLQKDACHYFLWFRTTGLYDTPARRPCVKDDPEMSAELENLLQREIAPRTVEAIRLYVRRLLLQIPEDFFAGPADIDPRIREVLQLMSAGTFHFSNEEFAEKLHMSIGNFNHLFKQETGISPQRCFTQLRLAQALTLLDGGMEICEIAEKCGFSDRYHFSKLFKNQYGVPPGQWRRHNHPEKIQRSLRQEKR